MNCGRSPVDIQYDRVTDPFRAPLVPSDRLDKEYMSIHMYMNMVTMETITATSTINQIRQLVRPMNRIDILL